MSPHLLVNNQFVHCKGGNVVMLAAKDIEVSHICMELVHYKQARPLSKLQTRCAISNKL